ncbi:uncharacterized protein LOC108218629 isoform X4 [Daucus carota subsp. sativus]|uniref:uncharacterized protein LOC108218629 isoform X4 n=1 Tax=Daucus carota subsp. sativus TaxID=79200 RepID=UPI0030828603
MAGQNQGGGGNVDLFDAYFRRADLDHDGRISGAEAVSFFQASNLSKQVLAQIWMHADQNRTGFLGRAEFYNALKLVTVAQSKRDLTPDIVKAALYGPASAKIPAPQINLAALSAPQTNLTPPATAPQISPRPPYTAPQVNSRGPSPTPHANQMPPSLPQTQNFGFRGQVPPNTGMNQQYFPAQANQSMGSPVPMPSGTAPRPLQGVSGSSFLGGGSITSSPVSANLSNDWLGGQSGVSSTGPPSSQVPSRGISPSIPSYGQKLPDPVSIAKSPAGPGNGFASNSMFGGDMFSANQSAPKQASSAPTYSANTAPSSSGNPPVTSATQPSTKLDPLESLNAFTRQSKGGISASQPVSKPNQQLPVQNNSSVGSSAMPAEMGNSASSQPQPSWPKMTRAGIQRYHKVFVEVDTDRDGRITGEQARNLFLSWRLPREVLKQVWDLSDQDNDSMLSLREFCVALYLMERYREGQHLPETLPNSVMLDETLLALAGPPTASYGSTAWGSAPGMRSQGMPGSQPVNSAASRTPMPSGFSNQQKAGVSSMENSQMSQQSNGGHPSADVKNSEESETEKVVENKEKMLLDSREKLVFYREKMQDLVLFKSRCENRLNEITERAIADKREAELLGKKYEEKYKQVAEIASKLTIEEAAFREIQERKMEYNQAIIKMQQGGSADGILQVRADRLQSDLEELLKALTERCKRHGVQIKSAAVIELPKGWQPGIPEVSAIWDEEWDKFDDEGFSFDVLAPTDAKSGSSHNEISSPNDILSPDNLSNMDDKSENLFNQGEDTIENESAFNHSGEMYVKSPTESPTRQNEFESPSRDGSDNHFRKSFEADNETQRSFDEPTWGTFDNNDDTDSVWGFSSMNAKDSDHEKHGEKSFFESSNFAGSPVRTGSPDANDLFPKKSPFGFEDSFPSSPLSRAGNSPSRYSEASGDQFFNNMSRFDSFGGEDRDVSSRRESFARFDSMTSSSGFDHSRGFSFDDSDPFGSSGPFKVSSGSETQKKESDNWNAF